VLLDTNVLVYAYDSAVPEKQVQALAVMSAIEETGFGAISTQVLSEFFHVITRRLKPPLTAEAAILELKRHASIWTVLSTSTDAILLAASFAGHYRMNFWDAQLWAVAKLNAVHTILSEDFNSGSSLGGVHFLNPFAPGFRL